MSLLYKYNICNGKVQTSIHNTHEPKEADVWLHEIIMVGCVLFFIHEHARHFTPPATLNFHVEVHAWRQCKHNRYMEDVVSKKQKNKNTMIYIKCVQFI